MTRQESDDLKRAIKRTYHADKEAVYAEFKLLYGRSESATEDATGRMTISEPVVGQYAYTSVDHVIPVVNVVTRNWDILEHPPRQPKGVQALKVPITDPDTLISLAGREQRLAEAAQDRR